MLIYEGCNANFPPTFQLCSLLVLWETLELQVRVHDSSCYPPYTSCSWVVITLVFLAACQKIYGCRLHIKLCSSLNSMVGVGLAPSSTSSYMWDHSFLIGSSEKMMDDFKFAFVMPLFVPMVNLECVQAKSEKNILRSCKSAAWKWPRICSSFEMSHLLQANGLQWLPKGVEILWIDDTEPGWEGRGSKSGEVPLGKFVYKISVHLRVNQLKGTFSYRNVPLQNSRNQVRIMPKVRNVQLTLFRAWYFVTAS